MRAYSANRNVLFLYVAALSLASAAIPLGGYYVKYDWLGSMALCMYGAILLMQRGANTFALTYALLYIAYLFLSGLLAALTAGDNFNLAGYSSYLLQYLLVLTVFVVIVSMRLDTAAVTRVLHAWVIVACAACGLALLQKGFNSLLIDRFLFIPYYAGNTISYKVVYGVLAPTAWFSEASWFGSFLIVPTVFVGFHLLNGTAAARARSPYRLAFILLVLGIILSYSLTAALSVMVGVGAILFLSGRARRVLPIVAALAIALLVVFANTPLLTLQAQRFAELANNLIDFQAGSELYGRSTSFYVRSLGFYEGFVEFTANPIFGNGLGQSPAAHSSALITLVAELGVLGAALYFLAPTIAVSKLWRQSRTGLRAHSALAMSLIACIAGDYANGMITHHSFHLQRWLLVSLVLSWIAGLRPIRPHYNPRTAVDQHQC